MGRGGEGEEGKGSRRKEGRGKEENRKLGIEGKRKEGKKDRGEEGNLVFMLYQNLSSISVYVAFLDASKAFDKISHWTLF